MEKIDREIFLVLADFNADTLWDVHDGSDFRRRVKYHITIGRYDAHIFPDMVFQYVIGDSSRISFHKYLKPYQHNIEEAV